MTRELFTRPGFEAFVLGLPAVTLVEQWGSSVAKVGGQSGGKVFAQSALTDGHISFKVSELAFEGLTSFAGIGQAAYSAKRQWVSVAADADLSEADLQAYIVEAHRIIAGKLTRKLRLELGIDDLPRGGPGTASAAPPAD
ncbi:MAG: yjbR family protein [Devosia sp.]|nr:yjbR family protein [Devosia sp.]